MFAVGPSPRAGLPAPPRYFFFPTMSVAPLVVADRKYSENKNIMDLNWAADRGCEEPAKVKAAHSCLTL